MKANDPWSCFSPPRCSEEADHTSCHPGGGHLFCSDFFSLTCIGTFPSCHVICLHRRGELADSDTSGWTSSETNLQPSLPRKARTTGSHVSLPKKGWTVVLEAGQSEAKYRMWSCLSVTSLHHYSLALPPPQSRPHQFFARLLAPHKHPAIHTVMNCVLPWTSLNKSLPPFPILPSLNQTVSPKRESICCTDTEKDDHLGGSFVLLFSFLSLGSQCWTGEA